MRNIIDPDLKSIVKNMLGEWLKPLENQQEYFFEKSQGSPMVQIVDKFCSIADIVAEQEHLDFDEVMEVIAICFVEMYERKG